MTMFVIIINNIIIAICISIPIIIIIMIIIIINIIVILLLLLLLIVQVPVAVLVGNPTHLRLSHADAKFRYVHRFHVARTLVKRELRGSYYGIL